MLALELEPAVQNGIMATLFQARGDHLEEGVPSEGDEDVAKGIRELGDGRHREALEHFRHATMREGGNDLAFCGIAIALPADDVAGKIGALSAAIRCNKSEPIYYLIKASAEVQARHYDAAASDLRMAIRLQRKIGFRGQFLTELVFPEAFLYLSNVLAAAGALASAYSSMQEYVNASKAIAFNKNNIKSIMRNIHPSFVEALRDHLTSSAPRHPGLILNDIIGDSPVVSFVDKVGITREHLYKVLRGQTDISPRVAKNLELAGLGGTALEWLALQSAFDLAKLEEAPSVPARTRRSPAPRLN